MTDSSDHWVRFDPAGCAHSSAYVTEAGLLAEDAYKTFVPQLADRRGRPPRAGLWCRLTHPDWLTQAGPCFYGTCRHQAAAKTTEVRGLTMRQPWAWALLHGKAVENRSWPAVGPASEPPRVPGIVRPQNLYAEWKINVAESER
ncbi:hypothetical protein ACWGQT_04265 [Streptomyces yangpuensis]